MKCTRIQIVPGTECGLEQHEDGIPCQWRYAKREDADIQTLAGPVVPEAVDHPAHYNANPSGVECIDVAEWFGFNLGSALKYIWRAGEKGSQIEDLRKAEWYIRREIQRLEKM